MLMQLQTILFVISFPPLIHSSLLRRERFFPLHGNAIGEFIALLVIFSFFFPDIVPDPRLLLAYSILFVCVRPWETWKCKNWHLRRIPCNANDEENLSQALAQEPRWEMYPGSWKDMFRCAWCPLPASLAIPCPSISLSNSTRQGINSTMSALWVLCSSQFAVRWKQSTEIVKKHERQTMVFAVSV